MHYMPVLKSKSGEFGALENLRDDVRDLVLPFVDVLPPSQFVKRPKKLDEHLRWVAEGLVQCWGGRPVIVDTHDLGTTAAKAGVLSSTYLFDQLRAKHVPAIPVTGLEREPECQNDVRQVAAKDTRGLCIRLEADDLELPKKLASRLDALCRFHGVGPAEADLVIDLRCIHNLDVGELVSLVRNSIIALPTLESWRSFWVASSNMPAQLTDVCGVGQTGYLARNEWQLWMELKNGPPALRRIPGYGDYTTVAPHYVDLDMRKFGKNLGANVKYTLERRWFVARGKPPIGPSMLAIARAIGALRGFRKTASYGDRFIHDRANGLPKPGNREQWITATVNSHINWKVQLLAS